MYGILQRSGTGSTKGTSPPVQYTTVFAVHPLYLEPIPGDDLLRLLHHGGSEVLWHLAVVEGQLHVLVLDPRSIMACLCILVYSNQCVMLFI